MNNSYFRCAANSFRRGELSAFTEAAINRSYLRHQQQLSTTGEEKVQTDISDIDLERYFFYDNF